MKFTRALLTAALTGGFLLAANGQPFAQDIRSYEEGDLISLTGTVLSTSGEEFVLAYEQGNITVDMDDWDWFINEAERLNVGETVTVSGVMDDDFFDGREIEADTVYVHDRYVYYYGDNTDFTTYYYGPRQSLGMPEGTQISAAGIVTDIEGREFTLETGQRDIQVDTMTMAYNPLDDNGYQRINLGDRVSVYGALDVDFFENREIDAMSIVKLSPDARGSAGY